MHVSTKLVPATFTLIFVLAALVTMLHKILHIFIDLKSNFYAMLSYRNDLLKNMVQYEESFSIKTLYTQMNGGTIYAIHFNC